MTIVGLTAATTFQLTLADVFASCHCAINGTMNTIYTEIACAAYPRDHVVEVGPKTPIGNLSAVSIHISNTTLYCTSFDRSTNLQVPFLGGDEFSSLCLEAAPTTSGIASQCEPFGQTPMALNGTRFGEKQVRRGGVRRSRRYGGYH